MEQKLCRLAAKKFDSTPIKFDTQFSKWFGVSYIGADLA
jgi:hypothetical protein